MTVRDGDVVAKGVIECQSQQSRVPIHHLTEEEEPQSSLCSIELKSQESLRRNNKIKKNSNNNI